MKYKNMFATLSLSFVVLGVSMSLTSCGKRETNMADMEHRSKMDAWVISNIHFVKHPNGLCFLYTAVGDTILPIDCVKAGLEKTKE